MVLRRDGRLTVVTVLPSDLIVGRPIRYHPTDQDDFEIVSALAPEARQPGRRSLIKENLEIMHKNLKRWAG